MGIVVPTAVITALVLIAAGANQWTSKQMGKAHGEVRKYLNAWLNYTWRFTAGGWPDRIYAGQLAMIGTVLLLSGLLVWCLLRGPITWGRAFFGTWLAVLFATAVGAVVRGLIAPTELLRMSRMNRVAFALLSDYGPGADAVFSGLVLGLIVGLVTSLVAVVSRRPVAPAVPVPPGPPMFADYAPPPASVQGIAPPWQDKHFGPPAGDQPTTQLPPAPTEAAERPSLEKPGPSESGDRPDTQPTTQLPPPPPPPPPAGDQATTRFPRPPDDEDLGHIEH